LAIDGWPNLTAVGAATEVGGGAGGFYTQDDYRKLVAYAQSRYITIVPEIDVPGHVTAALASYPALSCDGKPQQVFTGISGGFSSLCASKQTTYTFLDDVFRQLAALTPGPYVGIGGDEAQAMSANDYAKIVDHAASAVRAAGKIPWGWEETVAASVGTPAVATYWNTGAPAPGLTQAANSGTQIVLDPANHTYLDQKYSASTELGLRWAGYVDVQNSYEWNPANYLPGLKSSAVLGVESDLWTETIASKSDIDYMVFPRLPAVAELGWSPSTADNWEAFRTRLASQGPRWSAMGIKYYRSTQIPWPSGS
jgi:hexosaminidase